VLGAVVLALDLALSCGWSVGGVSDAAPIFGTWKLPPYDMGHGRTFASYENELLAAFEKYQPAHVVFEAPFLTSAGAHTSPEAMYGGIGLAAITETACYRWSKHVTQRAPSTVRKRVLGRGRFASRQEAKAAVMAWCLNKGWLVQTTDEADAALVWRYETWLLSPQGTRAAA